MQSHQARNCYDDYFYCKVTKHGISPLKLLAAFDEGGKKLSRPLLAKDHWNIIPPPLLLPGETLILQQDRVTCVNTLSTAATGALHLTNYRILFTGKYMQNNKYAGQFNSVHDLAKLGYRYQERKNFLNKVSPGFRKLLSQSSRSFKIYRKLSQSSVSDHTRKAVSMDSLLDLSDSQTDEGCFDSDVIISIPLLSIHEIRKFPKQFLQSEKLVMLNDGVEVVTSHYLSVKLCLGEEESYDADDLISRLLRHSRIKSSASIFAYTYSKSVVLPRNCKIIVDRSAPNFYHAEREIQRMNLIGSCEWRVAAQTCSPHYPTLVAVPHLVGSAEQLNSWSRFFIDGCFPVLVWRDELHRHTLLRSASFSSHGFSKAGFDDKILESFPAGKFVVFTDRSIPKGCLNKGFECVVLDNLPTNNQSHQSAMKLLSAVDKSDDLRYLSALEESGWLQELEILLDYSLCVLSALVAKEDSSVLMAVGSGTERVAQICSLVQLLVDPYYRTLDGFQVLIQKEWLTIRHPFTKCNLIGLSCEDNLSPIFLQFLDCVWQIVRQFPTTFEFNDQLLEMLARHSYSGCFGTFLDKELNDGNAISIWSYVNVLIMAQDNICNANYDVEKNIGVLQPKVNLAHLSVWTWFTRYKKEENLEIASIFADIELEKLQFEKKELTKKHKHLLHKLSMVSHDTNATNHKTLGDNLSFAHKPLPDIPKKDVKQREVGESKFNSIPRSRDRQVYQNASAISKLRQLRNTSLPGDLKLKPLFSTLSEYLQTKGMSVDGSSQDALISECTCSGYLVKQGVNIKNWKKRWFVVDLHEKSVCYYETSSCQKLKGSFNYVAILSVREAHNKGNNLFMVETISRTYFMKAPNHYAMNLWITCLSAPRSCFVT